MPIQDELATVIRKARYLPELLPFFHAQDLAAGDNPIITPSAVPPKPPTSKSRAVFPCSLSLAIKLTPSSYGTTPHKVLSLASAVASRLKRARRISVSLYRPIIKRTYLFTRSASA